MSNSPDELHSLVLAFLLEELQRANSGRQCIRIRLFHAQPGFRADPLGEWNRDEDEGLFSDLSRTDELVSDIISRATEQADSYGAGKHRFQIVTEQRLGGRNQKSFSIAAAFVGDDGNALALTGETSRGGGSGDALVGVLSLQMRHNERLMGINGDMFKGSIAVLANTNEALRKELAEANLTIKELSRQLNDANDRKDERDMAAMKQIAADGRKDKMIGKALPLLPLVAAKIIGGGKDKDGKASGDQQTALQILATELKKSLTPAQIMKIAGPLSTEQKILFMELMKTVDTMSPPEITEDSPARNPADAGDASSPIAKAD